MPTTISTSALPTISRADTGQISENEVSRRQKEKRKRKPIWFCSWICKWPRLSFGLALSGQLVFFLITAILVYVNYDILPITFDRIPLDINTDVDRLRDLAWKRRLDEDNQIIDRETIFHQLKAIIPERTQISEPVEVYFEIEDGNVFTKENLQQIQSTENEFFNNEKFATKFCKIEKGSCQKSNSILRFFDGTYSAINPVLNDSEFDNIITVLNTVNTHPVLNPMLQYFLGKNAIISATKAYSPITRSMMAIGQPLAGYHNSTHNSFEQETKIKQFMFYDLMPIAEKYFKNGAGNMNFFYFSPTLLSVSITNMVIQDMFLAIGSLILIVILTMIQIRSLWITLFSVLSIVTGFFGANIFYRCILDYRYFGTFHVLALFIILGIGVDDIFVFMDTWKETGHHNYISLSHRMSDCYRKAARAMFYTSFTTALAFVVSASSPFLGIASFGVFAGLLVFVNYISVIVFLPTIVITYHKYFERFKCCCCCYRSDAEIVPALLKHRPRHKKRRDAIVKFLGSYYLDFVTHRHAKWCILAFFTILTVIFIYFASTLQVNEEQVKFLKDDTNFGKFMAKRSSAFSPSGSDTMVINIVWGLDLQDISECHHTDVKCTGTAVYDDTFRLESTAEQEALLSFCNNLRTLTEDKRDSLHILHNKTTNELEVDCFIHTMGTFYNAEGNRSNSGVPVYPADTNLSLPITADKVNTIMTANSAIYSEELKPGFEENFALAVSYWLYNGFTNKSGSGYKYFKMLGEVKNDPFTCNKTVNGYNYLYGTKLKFAAISVKTDIIGMAMGYPTGLPIRQKWEEFVKTELSNMPPGLQNGFQLANGLWHWLKVQQTLVSSAGEGIGIGLGVAFPILVFATSNVIVGLLATLTIACVTLGVIAMIPMAGWKLGMLESLNLVLVVGLAVDYVVHLAEGYSRSAHNDRLGRTRDSLEHVGISVLSGAITTLGSAMFMLFAQILFFVQFGVFMFTTILLSIVYAMGFFITLVALIGPENETGSLKPLYRWVKAKYYLHRESYRSNQTK